MGARFAKWRAVFSVGDRTPSYACIEANAHTLARYAALCQEAGLIPVVEPEVLMEGAHTIDTCREVTEQVLHTVFSELYSQRVRLEGIDPETEHGAAWIDLSHSGGCRRGC